MAENTLSEEAKQQAALFDRIGASYEAVYGDNPTQRAAVEWLIQRLPPGARVLDLGSGTGIPTARMLTEAGFDVVGVDTSEEMVRLARQNVPGATFHRMDMANLQLGPGQFHAITAFFSLLMLRKSAIEATLQRLITLLVPDGYLIVSLVEGDADYIQIPFLGQQIYVSAYLRDAFVALLQQHSLTVLDLQAVEFTPHADVPPETQVFFFC